MQVPEFVSLHVVDLNGSATALDAALRRAGVSLVRVEAPVAGQLADDGLPGGWPASGDEGVLRLDLTCGPDRDTLLAVLSETAIVIEGWRPGFADLLGLGYETLAPLNPAMVYLSQRDPSGALVTTLASLQDAIVAARATGAGRHLSLASELLDELDNSRQDLADP